MGWEANGISYSVPRQGLQALLVGRIWGPWGAGEVQASLPPPRPPPRVGCASRSKSFSAEAQAVDSRHPGSFPPAWQPNPFPPAQLQGRDLGWGGACSAQPHVWLRSPSSDAPPSLAPEIPATVTWSRPVTGEGYPGSHPCGLHCDEPACAPTPNPRSTH